MSLDPGAFAFGFIAEGVKRWRKRIQERRQRRKGKPMAIDIGTRTSTNAAVGGGTLGLVYVNLIEMLPYPNLVAALTTPEMIVLASVLLAGVVARFSKTPAEPKAL